MSRKNNPKPPSTQPDIAKSSPKKTNGSGSRGPKNTDPRTGRRQNPQANPTNQTVVPRKGGLSLPAPTSRSGWRIPRLPRIGVFGLFKRQYRDVEPKFSGRAELSFIEKDRAKPDFPKSLDCVLVIAKFIGHALEAAARVKYPTNRIKVVRGGLTAIRNEIERLLAL